MLLIWAGYFAVAVGQPIMDYNLPIDEEDEELLMLYAATNFE